MSKLLINKKVSINVEKLPAELMEGIENVKDILKFDIGYEGIALHVSNCIKGFEVIKENNNCYIAYECLPDFYRAFSLLIENFNKSKFSSKQQNSFDKLGIMLDNSRNAVLTIESLKKFARHIALLGFNRLMLYIEDIFEVEEEPYFGQFRGRYSKEEIKELDDYCNLFGIELVPCIQTLAHLNAPFKWWWYGGQIKDCDDILLIGDEMTYQFLDHIIGALAKMFSSKNVNIGLDEAFMMGMGKYFQQNGHRDRMDIFSEHLEKVIAICKKHGLKPCMWSDMIFKIAYGGLHYEKDKELPQEIIDRVPKGVGMIYWDYETKEVDTYKQMFRRHSDLGNDVLFAGCAWKHAGFAPYNKYSFESSVPALKACKESSVKDVFITSWGDNGGECSVFSNLPVFVLYAESAYGSKTDKKSLARRMQTCFHANFDDFLNLDLPNEMYEQKSPVKLNSSSKYILYNDPLLGLFDSLIVSGTYNTYYKEYKEILKAAKKRNGEWSYLFNTLYQLCNLLEVKCDIGLRMKQYYDEKNLEALNKILKEDIPLTKKRLKLFYNAFKEQWNKENKIFGFEVQDIRMGGLMKRIEAAEQRLADYLNKKIPNLPELEEKRLAYTGGEETDENRNIIMTYWNLMPTTGVL